MEQQPNQPAENYAVPAKNKRIGIALLIGPLIGLIFIFIAYALATFIAFQASGLSGEAALDSGADFGLLSALRVILGLLVIFCIIGIIVGIPLGIMFLVKKELISGKFDERSGKGKSSVVPEEIKGWNWGAAGLTWIWGVWHGVWISLLVFIPIVNIIMIIILGLRGSEWAWRAQQWESVEKFRAAQNKWKPWGIVFFVLMVLSLLSQFFGFSGH